MLLVCLFGVMFSLLFGELLGVTLELALSWSWATLLPDSPGVVDGLPDAVLQSLVSEVPGIGESCLELPQC